MAPPLEPVLTQGQRQTMKIRSWRDDLAPGLRTGEHENMIVLINNGYS